MIDSPVFAFALFCVVIPALLWIAFHGAPRKSDFEIFRREHPRRVGLPARDAAQESVDYWHQRYLERKDREVQS